MHPMHQQVKPGFTNYQPKPKYSWALSKIEGKGKLGKTKDLWKRSDKLNNSENLEVSENLKFWNILKMLKILKTRKILKIWQFLKEFWGLPCREIEQDLNLITQKVRPKAKRPQNNKNKIPTHPMNNAASWLVKIKIQLFIVCNLSKIWTNCLQVDAIVCGHCNG